METFLHPIVNFLNQILWDYVLIYLLLSVGAFFTIRFGFIQSRVFRSNLFKREPGQSVEGITGFQAFATGIASRVGTGNIVGVAVALTVGGPGAIFWMWVVALLGMSSAFVEATLAQIFKVRSEDGGFRGGPSYYIQIGLRSRIFGIVFALSLILAFGFVFNAVQVQSIAETMNISFGIPRHWVGLALMLLTAPVIFGGIRRVAKFAAVIVPIMALGYLGVAAFVLVTHVNELPGILSLIFRSAFGLEQAVGGTAGYAVTVAMMTGIKRGLFSNEAGMGSAPNAAAAAVTSHPVSQGLLQMLGVVVDTMIICTATALIILLSGEYVPGSGTQGASLTHAAITAHLGSGGGIFLTVAIFFFAYSSVLGNYAYAEGNVQFISKHPMLLLVFRLGVLGMVMFGATGSLPLVWNMADTSMGLMAVINLIAIVLLSKHAYAAWRDYLAQKKRGVAVPQFTRDSIPALRDTLPKDVW
ncbi:alanine:cation symporter family protein [Glaciimonas immobilis]|nr:alanine:cation symporter family protein [Glaciimonas immobilis]